MTHEAVIRDGLPRPEAQEAVDRLTIYIGPYAAVPLDQALELLGPERYRQMMANKIKSQGPGPKGKYIYPWNVVDYLDAAGPYRPLPCDSCHKDCQ